MSTSEAALDNRGDGDCDCVCVCVSRRNRKRFKLGKFAYTYGTVLYFISGLPLVKGHKLGAPTYTRVGTLL